MDTLSNPSLSDLSPVQKRALLADLLRQKAAMPQFFPLSFAQQGLWFLHQLAPENPFYNASCEIIMSGPLQKAVLEQSLSEMVRRHRILRTRFELIDDQPMQVVDPAQSIFLPIEDLSSLPLTDRLAEAQHLSKQEIRHPFDLARGPLLRARLLRLGVEEHWLLLSLHHIIADGWSLGILFSELNTLYAAFYVGRPSPLADLPMQYTDFALWHRQQLTGTDMQKQVAYWKEQLIDLPQLALPTDRLRPTVQTFSGDTEPFSLTPETTRRLQVLSQREGVTLFMTLLAGFSALLARHSGQEDITVGTPTANRTRSELEGLIGYFVNTLVLRTDLSGDPTVRELLSRVREVALNAYAHQDVPFERLVEELHPQRDLSQNPLFQVMLALQNAPYEPLDISGLKLRLSQTQSDTSKFDLFLSLWENAGRLSGMLEYSTDMFDASAMRRLLGHYQQVLTAMADHPEQRLSQLPLLTGVEREQLQAWNATRREYTQYLSLHQLFEQHAQSQPDTIALIFQGEYITYNELNTRANRVAHFLQHLDVGPDTSVGLCLERSADMLVGLLGILKSGATYVPLDPNYPGERLTFMLQNAQAPVMITQERLVERLPVQGISVLCLDTDWPLIATQSTENPDIPLHAQNLAYIIYTSGSTGQPKGIAMPHAALVNLFTWQQRRSALPPGARTLQFASLSFDVATQEIFCTLGFGQTLVLLSEDQRRDPAELLMLLANEAIERLFLPVVALQQLAESMMSGTAQHFPTALREVITAGEQLRITPALAHLFASLPTARLCNEYGPAECHVVSSYLLTGEPPAWPALPPIGRPIDNTELYVLDTHMQLVPIGVAGELFIGGHGLARGYLSRPDLTAGRFVPHPYSNQPGARLYRTGDLASYRSDGSLDFLGRTDSQVKIRGYRVEPGEIETLLRRYPAVQQAVVLARVDASNEKRLVAYIVPLSSIPAPTGSQLRQYLHAHLPDYMLPAHFVTLDALPITANGKLNRRALPLPEPLDTASDEWDNESFSPLEAVLGTIWSTVLGNVHVGLHDNFFEVGGHSLLATQVLSRIRSTFHVDLPVRVLFETPTIAQLAPRIAAARWAESGDQDLPVQPMPREPHTLLPLSFAQQRLWFLDQLAPGNPFYTMPEAWLLEGALCLRVLVQSLHALVQRHEALRTRFLATHGRPAQLIEPVWHVSLPVVDLTGLSSEAQALNIERVRAEQAGMTFDLSSGPPVHACLLRRSDHTHLLLLTVHHIIADGWSLGILLRELAAYYQAALAGVSPALPALPIQYADYALWQRSEAYTASVARQLSYWTQQLANAPTVLALPTDHPRPAVQSFHGASHTFTLSSDLTRALKDLSRREGVTLFMTLLAVFAILLARSSGQDDLLIGTPIANRTHEALEGLIGFFVNMLVLRTDLSGDPSFQNVLTHVRDVALNAYAHQDLPFEQLVDALQLERDLSRNPLFQVTCQLQHSTSETIDLPGVQLSPLEMGSDTTRFDLSLFLAEEADNLSGLLEYNTDLFEPTTIAGMCEHYLCLLEGIVAHPEQRVSALPLLSDSERSQLLVTWNATTTSYPQGTCVHMLVEAQVERTPDAIALMCGDALLTYDELNRRANQLAFALRERGIGTESLVAVCMDRTPTMVICLLAILKTGAAYLPLDPTYPAERLAFMLADARVPLVLTTTALSHILGLADTHASERLVLDSEPGQTLLAGHSSTNCPSISLPDTRAYVIYTSGSTGQPKGVQITQRGLTNLVCWHQHAFALTSHDRTSHLAGLSFDAAVWELWPSLATGATLCLVDEEIRTSSLHLRDWLVAQQITLSFLPTPLAEQLLDVDWPDNTALHTLLTGGDLLHHASSPTLPFVLVNNYGPTEHTVVTTSGLVTAAHQGIPSIGRPIANTRVYLLDTYLQPVPIGAPGNLYVGGHGLARGYLHRPDLTAERFLPDPFSNQPGARLYKTGDQARYRSDGSLDFLGRTDSQVKIRGYRVEPGEIETLLRRYPAVQQAVVLARVDASNEKRLVAYIVPLSSIPAPTGSQLRQYLHAHLPDYMLPAHFVTLDALPITANGKLNRRALPLPEPLDTAPDGWDNEGFSPLEAVLGTIWSTVLGNVHVGLHDNFFEVGGHSLLATQVLSRIRSTFHVDLPVRVLFETPTIAQLAPHIAAARWTESGDQDLTVQPTAHEPHTSLPLSFAQRRLWFLDQLAPSNPTYIIPAAWRFTGNLHVVALGQSLNSLVQRHETLRTHIITEAGHPAQVIDLASAIPLPLIDLTTLPALEREQQAQQLAQEQAHLPFDLAHGPLLRGCLVRLSRQEHWLLLSLHHIITDGWSMPILLRELVAGYQASLLGEVPLLPTLPIQYADYALWQHSEAYTARVARQLTYWTQQLADAPTVLALPTDHPRPAVQSFHGANLPFSLSPDLTHALKDLSRREGVTLFMTLLAVFAILLARSSGQDDLLIGTPIANRTHEALEGLIGFFVNMLVLRTDLSGDPSFQDVLTHVRDVALNAYAHQDLPFEQLVDALQLDRDLSRNPLFQVTCQLQHSTSETIDLPGVQLSPLEMDSDTTRFDLSLFLSEEAGSLSGLLEYNTDLFEPHTIERMLTHYHCLLAGIVAHPEQRISALPLLSESERSQLLVTWNATTASYSADAYVHMLVEAQVERTPDAIAIACGDALLTYNELNGRANQLARYLQHVGVGGDTLVGLCLEPSLEMVIGVLGILKAGGAYVPLDPSYPPQRLAFMVQDAHVPLLLTRQHIATRLRLTEYESRIVSLDHEWSIIAQESAANVASSVQPASLAYVIYTSGSTGQPKGVMIAHRGLTNYLFWCIQTYNVAQGSGSLVHSSLAFDLTVTGLFAPLLVGQSVNLLPDGQDIDNLASALRQSRNLSLVKLTPSHLALLAQQLAVKDITNWTHTFILGGEALLREHIAFWQEHAPHTRLINEYGPTETVVGCCVYELPANAAFTNTAAIPIGRPIANTQLYILDQQLNLVPVGTPGELYIGGDGVARGYLNHPDLTAGRFIPHPFSEIPGARLYRTGDLARYLHSGDIEYLGRNDSQVKIRGYRIEPGEIEATLAHHPAVREVAVVANADAPGDQRLAAYIVPRSQQQTPTVSDLRSFLIERLPGYMVPAAFVLLQALPLTVNGKLDHQALPALNGSRPDLDKAYVPPRTPAEKTLTAIWTQVLGVQQVGIHDNFFALGGDSILSIQIVTRATAAGLPLTPRRLFQNQTIAQLASVVGPAVTRQPEQELITGSTQLTPIQHWFFAQNLPEPQHWNQEMLLQIQQPLDTTFLQQALQALLVHHDALRLLAQREASSWSLTIAASGDPISFVKVDLAALPERQQIVALEATASQLQSSLDLTNGPIMRVALFDLGPHQRARLLLIIHHLAIDIVSWSILLEDLQSAYQQLSQGKLPLLPPKTTSFQHWSQQLADYAQSSTIRSQLDFWLNQPWSQIHPLPLDTPSRPEANTEASAQTVSVTLSLEETRALLSEVHQAYHTHINDLLLTALVQTLAHWTGTPSLLLHLEGHGREDILTDIDLSRTVGWFTSLAPIVLSLPGTTDAGIALKSVKEQLRRLPANGLSFGLLRYLSQDANVNAALSALPQPQVSFNYAGRLAFTSAADELFAPAPELMGATRSPRSQRPHLLDFNSAIVERQLLLEWTYSQNLHDHSTIEQLASSYLAALRVLIAHCLSPEVGGYTPSDFPETHLPQDALDALVARVAQTTTMSGGETTRPDIEGIYPLSPMQQGMLFHSLYAPESEVYFEQVAYTLQGNLSVPAFQGAWQQVVARHPILRTLFLWERLETPLQVVCRHVALPWTMHDWRYLSSQEQPSQLEDFLRADRAESFDLSHAPLIRLSIIRLSEQSYHFTWSFHHLLLDGWSVATVINEVLTCYEAARQQQPVHLAASRPYRDYIHWLQQQDLTQAEAYWRQTLQGFTAPTPLCVDRPPTRESEPTQQYAIQQIQLSAATTTALQTLARQQQLTLNTLVQGAWALLLSRYSGEPDVVFGVTVSGRPSALFGVEFMVGLFINTLPLRAQINPQQRLLPWLQSLQVQQAEARQFEYSPLAQI